MAPSTTDDESAAASPTGTILMVAVVLVGAALVGIYVLEFGGYPSDPAPAATFEFESNYVGDGVAKNDSVTITHTGGEEIQRERLEVVIDGTTVFNETPDSESNNPSFEVPGLVVEVDDDEFNDLNKPCKVDGNRVSPAGTCGGPPGDGDGSDPGVVVEWAENVSSGQRLVIQERNAANAYDVMEAGDSIEVIYRGDDFSAVIAEGTVRSEDP